VSITLVHSLESLGFWLAIPLAEALLCNDKFATAEGLSRLTGSDHPIGTGVYRP
jgi:hypothetical protein